MWRISMFRRGTSKFGIIPSFIVSILTVSSFGSADALAADDGRGERVFHLCKSCHGQSGEGNQAVGAPAIAGLPAWYVEAQLTKFATGARGTHPRDFGGMRMRPMARTLNGQDDYKAVAAYVSKLPVQELEPTITGSIVKGEESYAVCQACHGADGMGNKALNAPPLAQQSDWYLLTQLRHFKNGIRAGDAAKDPTGAAMVPMASILDDEAMKNVISYIHALK